VFAILVSEENRKTVMDTIADRTPDHPVDYDLFTNRPRGVEYYFVTGYVNDRGEVEPWAFLPSFVFRQEFEYDAERIQTEFDQIVRK
jgi:hypothetical protein